MPNETALRTASARDIAEPASVPSARAAHPVGQNEFLPAQAVPTVGHSCAAQRIRYQAGFFAEDPKNSANHGRVNMQPVTDKFNWNSEICCRACNTGRTVQTVVHAVENMRNMGSSGSKCAIAVL